MTTATIPPAGTVYRYWKTGLIFTQTDLTGIISADPAATAAESSERCQTLPPGSVLGLRALEEQFRTSMNALATAEAAPEVQGCQVKIQVWRNGYDQPAFSSQTHYAGTPGLPWGRQFLLTPVPGAHAVIPGWLTCSLVPLEHGQHITIAAAVSAG